MEGEADCPICLCPILSSSTPWGVSIPCGHAYHRKCWNEVVDHDHGSSSGGGHKSRKNKSTPCAICKRNTTGFVQVFIDLDVGTGENFRKDDHMVGGVIDVENDKDEEERLNLEWDKLWGELEELLRTDDDFDHCSGEIEQQVGASSASEVTRRDDYEMEQIYIAIDLTQPSPPRESSTTTATSKNKRRFEESEKRRRRNDVINRTFQRLNFIHHDIQTRQSCKITGGANSQQRHIARLQAQLKKIQLENNESSRAIIKLQETNRSLTDELSASKNKSFEDKVEMERYKFKFESLQKLHLQLEQENSCLKARHADELFMLNNTIMKLRKKNNELTEEVSLENIKELEEVRTKYAKMTQELHNTKMERHKTVLDLTKRVQELEGRYEREKSRHDSLKSRMAEEQRRVGKKDNQITVQSTKCAPSYATFHGGRDDTTVASKIFAQKHRSGSQQPPSSSSSTGNKALDALNSTSSRKFPIHLDPQPRYRPNHKATLPSSRNEDSASEYVMANGIHLLMRTGDIRQRSSKKRRNDDVQYMDGGQSNNGSKNCIEEENIQSSICNWSNDDILALRIGDIGSEPSRRSTTVVVAVHSPSTKRQGGIRSYFKSNNNMLK